MIRGGLLTQMIYAASSPTLQPATADPSMRLLTPSDVPAMVELAKLTEPGPFRNRTHELGVFFGIFEDGRLVSMAGQRMRVPGFVEVSAVCTHPDARGRGYARTLMSAVMTNILNNGGIPFLHSFADNHAAIRVYEALGFTQSATLSSGGVEKQSLIASQRNRPKPSSARLPGPSPPVAVVYHRDCR